MTPRVHVSITSCSQLNLSFVKFSRRICSTVIRLDQQEEKRLEKRGPVDRLPFSSFVPSFPIFPCRSGSTLEAPWPMMETRPWQCLEGRDRWMERGRKREGRACLSNEWFRGDRLPAVNAVELFPIRSIPGLRATPS